MTDILGKHLIKKHGYRREEFFDSNKIRIYAINDTWEASKWSEFIIYITNIQSIVICPKIENEVFTLGMYNLNPSQLKLKVTAKKGWNKLKFQGIVPFFEETLVKTGEFIFWNCELSTLIHSFVEYDSSLCKHYLELNIIRVD